MGTLAARSDTLETTVTQQQAQILQHKDQYNILKLKLGRPSHTHQQQHDLYQNREAAVPLVSLQVK